MNTLISWLVYSLAILITAHILPGTRVSNFGAVLVMALVLGILNALLRPIILFFTLPLNILTLGLFTFIINALIVYLADKIVPGFQIDTFWWAFIFAIILALIHSVLLKIFPST